MRKHENVANEPRYPPEGLVPYDPAWPLRYGNLARRLQQVLGDRWRIEHIGSTAVPGLVAKPVIDLALRVPDPDELCAKLPDLEAAGWTDLTPLPTHQALFQLDEAGTRRAIAHLFSPEQWSMAPQRLFPAWLRTHPHDREAYARLKLGLREGGTWGYAYTDAKAEFVQDVSARAIAAAEAAELLRHRL
jgi:GrpB-like predicted nucleotidyltransferase (UPF0157 family)